MSVWPFVHFFCVVMFTLMALFVLFQNRRASLNRVCSVVIGCFAGWSLGKLFASNPSVSRNTAVLASHISSAGWIGLSSFFLWFSLLFIQEKYLLKKKIFYVLIFLLPAFFIYKNWRGDLHQDLIKQPYGWVGMWAESIWTYIFYFYYFSFLVLALFLIFRFGKKTNNPIKKKQSFIIFYSGTASLILGAFTDVISAELKLFIIPSIANAVMLIWAGALIYAVFRYKLMSITLTSASENIVTAMKDPLFLVDGEEKIVSVNRASLDLLGYNRRELIGKSMDSIFENKQLAAQLVQRTRGNEKKWEAEFHLRAKNGKRIPVIFSCSLLKDKGDLFVGYACIAKDMTEYRWAVEAQKESEEKFRNIAENLPYLVFINVKGKFVYVNDQCKKMLGYSKEEFYSPDFHLYYLIAEDSLELARDHFQRAMKGQEIGSIEYSFHTKQKKSIEVQIITRMITFRGEKALLGIVQDISERKRKEKLLKNSEKKYRDLSENLEEVVYQADPQTLAPRYVNSAVEDLFGYTPVEWMEDPTLWKKTIHPDDKNRVVSDLKEVSKKGKKKVLEYRIIREDKSIRWVRNRISCETDYLKNITRLTGVIFDITDQRMREKALKVSENRYRDLVEKAGIGVAINDPEGNLYYFNNTFAELFGYTKEEMQGKSFQSLVSIQDYKKLMKFDLRNKAEPSRYEVKGNKKGGNFIYLEVDRRVLKSREKVIGTRLYLWDVTEKKKAEQELKKYQTKLEKLVEKRTAELKTANKKLKREVKERKQAQKQIKASLQEKEILLREIHHRVKNNLHLVISLLRLQSSYVQNQQDAGMFKECEDRIRAMATIHEKLYKSKDLANVSFTQYLQGFADYLFQAYNVDPRRIQLNTEMEEVSLDLNKAIHCGLIVNELLSNSLKHAFSDGQEGQVNIRLHSEKQNKVLLEISDNGSGIPQNKHLDQGDSLGMKLVYGLVDQIGGTLNLDKKKGTRFQIIFPF
ncbi:PAS domain S-box protein [bacterium]|nr:PAS domain S-box protein [bacterium]